VTKRVEFLPVALDEVEEGAAWYRERDPRVSRAFAAEVDRAVELISESPQRWPAYHHGTYRVLLEKYPYSLVYRDEPDRVLVVALAHFKKKPGYWHQRLMSGKRSPTSGHS